MSRRSTSTSSSRDRVDQSYVDHKGERATLSEQQALSSLRGKEVPFPLRLHKTIELATKSNSPIVSWLPHGRAFMVHDKIRFEAEVLGPYLQIKSMDQFKSQLASYGFRRLGRGSGCDAGGYYHELFLKRKDFLAFRMTKTSSSKGKGYRKSSSESSDPDLYRLPSC
mmetsp:Transcript_11346/g.17014  ORF Transcript_11346/g.17014 Transcript_11346/m.17014 type:complete len:167 (+) Transcript_11346:230-730(+)|eukprot:CAMPEP_0196812744 /NCGR_PEP_ID=MMETSP1362-20130617/30212_1 /TAXON_ID=163516 /ORGANISM="Leptocylindrus danicus, Strain CCMP1856" /LENGTH=166 /DNA_ID=CAMNT_0042188593 /DNA_START=134 /DNA_END=634 /DNA_ORIENTATION=+